MQLPRPSVLPYLWLGMAVGLALALGAVARPAYSAQAVPAGAVALVNGQPIASAEYQTALRAIRLRAKREQPSEADKRAALEQVIDAELLIERGTEFGFVRSDPSTRQALINAVWTAERATALARTPSDAELERYYTEQRASLQRPGKLRARQVVVRAPSAGEIPAARARAQSAAMQLRAGVRFELVLREFGDPVQPPLPDGLASVSELYDALGPVAIEALLKLEPGQVSDVIGGGQLLRVLVLVERLPAQVPKLSEIRAELIHRYRNHTADKAYEAKLAALRANATIQRRSELP